MRVEYHPATVSDLNNAAKHYNEQRPGLGEEFRAEAMDAIERIRSNPHMYPIVKAEISRCLLFRFPYSVLYRVLDEKSVRILAIRHHRRHQEYGLRRR